MPAFFENPIKENTKMNIHIFAPPATGENSPEQGEDWIYNYYCTINRLPEIRLRYDFIESVG